MGLKASTRPYIGRQELGLAGANFAKRCRHNGRGPGRFTPGGLVRGTPPPSWTQDGPGGCIWMPLVNGTGNSPSPGRPTPGVVKQDKSCGGSVDTTKTR